MATQKTGWLQKKGHFRQNWRLRWFTLSNDELTYFAKEGDSDSKGYLSVNRVVDIPDRGGRYLPHRFDVVSENGAILCIAAASAEEKTEWMQALGVQTRSQRAATHPVDNIADIPEPIDATTATNTPDSTASDTVATTPAPAAAKPEDSGADLSGGDGDGDDEDEDDGLNTPPGFCSIMPYFKLPEGKTADIAAAMVDFEERTRSEDYCLWYGWDLSEDGKTLHCREAYTNAAAVLLHLDNVEPSIKAILDAGAELTSISFHGPAAELDKLREPTKELQPRFFAFDQGLQNFAPRDMSGSPPPLTACTIQPFFHLANGKEGVTEEVMAKFTSAGGSESAQVYYGWTYDADSKTLFCREGYNDADAVLAHLANVQGFVAELLAIDGNELERIEFHGPASELDALREGVAHLSPVFFATDSGFQRVAHRNGASSSGAGATPDTRARRGTVDSADLRKQKGGDALVGRRIAVVGKGEGEVVGIIKSRGKSTKHTVHFDDGSREDILLSKDGGAKGTKFYVFEDAASSEVQKSWDNHFAAFGDQDLERIMLDYTEDSEIRVFDHRTQEKTLYTGLAGVRKCFEGLFAQLSDLSALTAPVVDVQEATRSQVFLVWSCASSGVLSATDTFTFDEAGKIKNQNVALTSAAPSSPFHFVESAAAKCRGQRPAWQQTMLRIKDPKKSLPYYTEIFGMTLIDVFDFPSMKFSLYFLTTLPKGEEYTLTPGSPEAHAYNWSMKGTTLELTYNYGSEADDTKYHAGNEEKDGFGHIAFNCNDVYEACAKLEEQGVTFKKKPDEGRMKGLAFAYDPDGYWVEIVRRAEGMDPAVFPYYNFSQTMLRVKDPEKSLAFYRDALGMTVLSQKTLGEGTDWGFSLYFLGTVAEGEEAPTPGSSFQPCLELTHNHGTETDASFAHFSGNEDGRKGFGHLGFLVDDVYEASAAFKEMGCEFVKEPDGGSMKGLAFVKDPDGYWIEIIKRGGEERIDAMAATDTHVYGV